MRYLLLVYMKETLDAFAIADQDQARLHGYMVFGAKPPTCDASGILFSTMTATTIRIRAGQQILVDGPAVETPEQLRAFYLVTCHQRDDALALAAQIAYAQPSTVEVRTIATDAEETGIFL